MIPAIDPAFPQPLAEPVSPPPPRSEDTAWMNFAEAPIHPGSASDLGWVIGDDPFVDAPGDDWSPVYLPPTDLGDVVVVGDKEGSFWWFNGGNWSWYIPSSGMLGAGPMPDGTYTPPVQDHEPPVSHDGQPESLLAAAQLAQVVHKVDEEIDNIPDAKQFILPDGRIVTGAEIKIIWNNMSFIVTTRFPYGTDRGGANNNGIVSIGSETINGYAAYGLAGSAYMLLHELAHTTPLGQVYDQQFWTAYQNRTGTSNIGGYNASAPEFVSNEKYANEIARIISTGTLLPFMSDPPHSYPGMP